MSHDEKIAVGVGIGLLVGFITEPLHGVHPAWVAVLATGVLAATRVVTVSPLRAVNWNFALLFGVLISLATVFSRTGLDRWIADRVTDAMGDPKSIRMAFLVLLTLFCFAVSFVLRWQAAAPLVTIAMAPVASAAGVHPFIVGVIAVIACNGFGSRIRARPILHCTLARGARSLVTVKPRRPQSRMASGHSSPSP